MRCAGRVDGQHAPETGLWILRYDPKALSGRGWVRWTGNPAEAMRFTTPGAAQAAQQAVSILAAFRIKIEPAR